MLVSHHARRWSPDSLPATPRQRLISRHAHECAFERWSRPDDVVDSHEAAAADEAPASFRVYTPMELRTAPLRPVHRPSKPDLRGPLESGLVYAQTLRPLAVLKWTVIGLVGFTSLFAAVVALANLTDDTRHSTLAAARNASLLSPSEAATSTSTNASQVSRRVAEPRAATDLELPDDTVPITKAPRSAKGKAKRKIVRKAPY